MSNPVECMELYRRELAYLDLLPVEVSRLQGRDEPWWMSSQLPGVTGRDPDQSWQPSHVAARAQARVLLPRPSRHVDASMETSMRPPLAACLPPPAFSAGLGR